MSNKSSLLLTAYKNLDWDTYVDLCDSLTSVNKDSIDLNLQLQSSLYSHYAGLEALARLEVDRAETMLEMAISRARQKAEISSVNLKLTEKKIEAHAAIDSEVYEAKESLHKAEYRYNLLHGLVKALDQKKDCLIQMSSNHRAEMNLVAKG